MLRWQLSFVLIFEGIDVFKKKMNYIYIYMTMLHPIHQRKLMNNMDFQDTQLIRWSICSSDYDLIENLWSKTKVYIGGQQFIFGLTLKYYSGCCTDWRKSMDNWLLNVISEHVAYSSYKCCLYKFVIIKMTIFSVFVQNMSLENLCLFCNFAF